MREFTFGTWTKLSLMMTVPDCIGLKVDRSSGMLLGQSVLFWLLLPCMTLTQQGTEYKT